MTAHLKLVWALRDSAEQVSDLRDGLDDADAAEYHRASRILRDACTLLRVLANVADGMPLLRAMGSPGDWGYDTPIGQSLVAALREQAAPLPIR